LRLEASPSNSDEEFSRAGDGFADDGFSDMELSPARLQPSLESGDGLQIHDFDPGVTHPHRQYWMPSRMSFP